VGERKRRPPIVGRFTQEELALATRNRGMPLEPPWDATGLGNTAAQRVEVTVL
jgi:hypothetical protein